MIVGVLAVGVLVGTGGKLLDTCSRYIYVGCIWEVICRLL